MTPFLLKFRRIKTDNLGHIIKKIPRMQEWWTM
jgi:hypothetical protein